MEVDVIVDNLGNEPIYMERDNQTQLSSCPPCPNVLTRRQNIVLHHPGVKCCAINAKTVTDLWKLSFTDDIIGEIVNCTNIYISKLCQNYCHDRDCRDTTFEEICAVVGFLYMLNCTGN